MNVGGGGVNIQSLTHSIPDHLLHKYFLCPYYGNSGNTEGKQQSPVVKSMGFHIREIQV